MRSRTFVKRTVPCLAVVLAVTMQGNVAHAGLFDAAKAMASALLNKHIIPPSASLGKSMSQTTTAQASTATTHANPVHAGAAPDVKAQAAATAAVAHTATANADATVVVAKDQTSIEESTWKALQTLQNKINTSAMNASSATDDIGKLRGAAQVRIERVSQVNNDNHSRLSSQYTDKELVFTLSVDDTALKNPELLIKDVSMIMALTHTISMGYSGSNPAQTTGVAKAIESPHSWTEGYLNAAEGSIISQARLKNIEAVVMDSNVPPQAINALKNGNAEALGKATEQILKDLTSLRQQAAELDAKATKFARQQQKDLDKWRSETGTLDKYEAMNLKLNDLMLKNDRKGVRDMLEAYLPWQIMEPTEYKAWKTWLDAIEHPNLSKTTVAFRGLDYKTDKIQRMEISKGGEEKFAFMSTVLTKNQGSYTRRLRSLSTNREKNGDEGQKAFEGQPLAIKITDQMTAHARNPIASSFLSFTYNPFIARGFIGGDVTKTIKGEQVKVANGGLLAVRVDSRRMVPNVVSMYAREIELLAPLIIFPDEVVAYHEGDFREIKDGKDSHTRMKEFIAKVSAATGTDFSGWSQWESSAPFKERFKKDGLKFLKDLSEQAVNAPFCSKIF